MKHLLLIVIASTAFILNANAQCLAHVKYSASKMEILDTSLALQDTREEPLTFEVRPDGFTGIRENQVEDSLHGVLKSVTCNWKEPFKNGTITMICDVQGAEHDMQDAQITIEAVEGKLTIYLRVKEQADKVIRLPIDKYEEVK